MLDSGRSKNEIIGFVSSLAEKFNKLLNEGIARASNITTRKTGILLKTKDRLVNCFNDLDMWDLFERLLSSDENYKAYKDELEREGLTGDRLKEITLTLAEKICPEAVKEDRGTKKEISRAFHMITGILCGTALAIGIALAFAHFPVPIWKLTIFFSVSAYVGIYVSTARFGLLYFYKRIGKLFFQINKFWGIDTWARRIGFGTTLLSLAGFGIYLAIWQSLALGTLTVMLAVSLSPILWGRTSSAKEKLFWGTIFATASSYVFGLMVHHLFWKLVLIDIWSAGFIFTLGLLFLTFIPTLISVYHAMVTLRSYTVLNTETWSNTLRSLVGLKSFLRFKPVNWEKIFGEWIRECKEIEYKYMPLTTTGQSAAEYFEDLIIILHKTRAYISDTEKDLWLKALRGEEGGRFVKPASPKGFEIIYNAFFALSQKKPATDVYALLSAI
jgi:hypothetical protein